MNKQSFEKIILNLQAARKRSRELYKLGVDLMEYDESYEFVIDELFKALFNEVQRGWVDWFLYERESHTGKILKAHKKVGRKKVELADKIENIMNLVDRGELKLNSAEDVITQFEGYNINIDLLKEIVNEEFDEGYRVSWKSWRKFLLVSSK
jgi:hypothetical protein